MIKYENIIHIFDNSIEIYILPHFPVFHFQLRNIVITDSQNKQKHTCVADGLTAHEYGQLYFIKRFRPRNIYDFFYSDANMNKISNKLNEKR